MIRKLTDIWSLPLSRTLCFLALIAAFAGPALAEPDVRIVVLNRDIARGEVIADSDLAFGTVASTALMNGTVTNMDAARGMEARRALRAEKPFLASDMRRPVVVTRGQTVTMTFNAPGVDLVAMGRAMSEGGVGDTVTIQNPASFRMITGIVIAAGTVRATGPLSNGSSANGSSANGSSANGSSANGNAFPNQLTARK
jgi:flagella basal body P-ring formation protein FlgA